jgi:DNA-binding response OmpR family regulator
VSTTVLIADEEADLREYLADLFRARGCRVLVASDGVAALDQITGHAVHLAVIDMLLPGGSGFKLLQDFKSRAAEQGRAVMISRNGSPEHQEYAHLLGADLFLIKPFEVEKLMQLADEHFQRLDAASTLDVSAAAANVP